MKSDYSTLSLLSTGRHVSQPGMNGCKVILFQFHPFCVTFLVKPLLHQGVIDHQAMNCHDDGYHNVTIKNKT